MCDIVSCSENLKTASPKLEQMTGLAAIPEVEHSQDTDTNTIISLTEDNYPFQESSEKEDFILITASQIMTQFDDGDQKGTPTIEHQSNIIRR